jgi:hypothetical protein
VPIIEMSEISEAWGGGAAGAGAGGEPVPSPAAGGSEPCSAGLNKPSSGVPPRPNSIAPPPSGGATGPTPVAENNLGPGCCVGPTAGKGTTGRDRPDMSKGAPPNAPKTLSRKRVGFGLLALLSKGKGSPASLPLHVPNTFEEKTSLGVQIHPSRAKSHRKRRAKAKKGNCRKS